MPAVTLLLKAYDNAQLEQVDRFLKTALEGLKIEIEPCEITSHDWVQTVISGEDETVAQNYLAREIGLCPTRLEFVSKFSTMKGQIRGLEGGKEVVVDVGIFSPEFVTAKISTSRLQTQLVDGRKTALIRIAELFGFSKNLPLFIKILNVDKEGRRLEAELAEKQLTRYREWVRSMLDRLLILGASSYDVESALKREGFERDVVNVEALGLFDHVVTCKLGTDAVGLIPKIGRRLQSATLTAFTPKKILNFLGQEWNLLTFSE